MIRTDRQTDMGKATALITTMQARLKINYFEFITRLNGTWGSVVVKALRY